MPQDAASRLLPRTSLALGPADALFGSGLDDQFTIETYYRLQVTRELAITPSIQLLIDPAINPEKSTLWVFGVRARVAF